MPDFNVEVLSETVLDGLRLSDWIEQMGVSRSAAYELLKITGIEPEPRKVPGSRKPVSHLTRDQIDVLEPLARQLADGATMPQLRKQLEQSSTVPDSSGLSKTAMEKASKQSGIVPADMAPLLAAMAQVRSEPHDPLALAKRLADAAQLGVPLTNAEMAAVLGRASVSPKHNGTSPCPGFTLERIEHNGTPFWMVHRVGAPTAISASPQANQPQGRQVGFTAASMAVIDVQARDCTGSDLFAATTIG